MTRTLGSESLFGAFTATPSKTLGDPGSRTNLSPRQTDQPHVDRGPRFPAPSAAQTAAVGMVVFEDKSMTDLPMASAAARSVSVSLTVVASLPSRIADGCRSRAASALGLPEILPGDHWIT